MRAKIISAIAVAAALLLPCATLSGQVSYESSADFTKYAEKLRESTILNMEPHVFLPMPSPALKVSGKYPWKTGIVTTVFWIGNARKGKGDTGASAWDPKWQTSYGGYDNPHPEARRNFIPAAFVPRLNPFYIALPYNDVGRHATKSEARIVIPWFKEAFVEEGKSVCRDRWLAVRNSAGKVCFAQWSDCGPFTSDHWQYVFGNEKPRPNANGGAGLNVSPAVRDYLELSTTDVTDWKFVEAQDIPRGPWALYGENNTLVQKAHRPSEQATVPTSLRPPAPAAVNEAPSIITKKADDSGH